MLLYTGSLIFILLWTGYMIYYLYQRRDKVTRSGGGYAAIVFAALAGLACGVVSAQAFPYHSMISAAAVALFAAATGYLAGRPFDSTASVNGGLAGLLGALLGTVAGVMVYTTASVILIADISFIASMFVVQKMIDAAGVDRQQNRKKRLSNQTSKRRRFVYAETVVLASFVVGIAGMFLLYHNDIAVGRIGEPQTQTAAYDEENDLQTVMIDVTSSGFGPRNTDFTAGTTIKATFRVQPNAGTGHRLVSEQLGIDAALKEGDNRFIMNNPQPGVYEYRLDSGAVGTITVK